MHVIPTVEPAKPNILPTETKGESSPIPIWTSVGYALSEWEFLQDALANLFVSLSGAEFRWPIMRAFGLNMVVHSKIEMINCAAEATLSGRPDILQKVLALTSLVKGYNERRNDIAHGVTANETEAGYYLVPTVTTTKKYKDSGGDDFPPPAYCWTSAQIYRYAHAFAELQTQCKTSAKEVDEFMQAVRGARRSHQALLSELLRASPESAPANPPDHKSHPQSTE